MKKLKTDKTYFVNQAREVHGDTYGYDDFDFQGMHEKGMITCKIHGNFPMTPHAHITNKQGCPKCGILKRAKSRLKFNTETYKEEIKKTHGDKYILDEIEFTRLEDKIKVICPKHGPWYPTAKNFRDGHGCPECGRERMIEVISDTKEDFVRKAREVWGDLYGYDDFDYQGSDVPGKIWCYECNDYFWKAPNAHLSGHQGCTMCSQKNRVYRNNVEKGKETCMEKYGVPFSFQVEEVKEKIKQTNLERYGVENPTYNRALYEESIKKLLKETYEKYTKDLTEVEPLFTADEYKGISKETENGKKINYYPFKCKKCGSEFNAPLMRPRCVKCHPYSRSEGEIEMADYIESIYPGEVVYNDPSVLNNNGYNFDVYLPEEKIAFEYNGDYWHNRDDIKERDAKKKELADEAGIKIVYIWEHEWADNKDEMKKLIDNAIKE